MIGLKEIKGNLKKLFTTPTDQLGKAGRFVVFQVKLWNYCGKLLVKNKSGQQAAALSYHTIFGLVPLAIMVLLIFQSFPAYESVGNKFKNIVYDELRLNIQYPDPDNTGEMMMPSEEIDQIVESFFTGLNEGRIALVSTIIILWAAIGLLSTIERSFNNIWHVGKGRNFINRVINYWAVLTLGPLLLGVGIYFSTRFAALSELQRRANVAPAIVSYFLAVVVFFFLYYVLPNTKVKGKAAFWGALGAALGWAFAK
nr:YihY family inner membrane protein [Planctomycetota bacterium]